MLHLQTDSLTLFPGQAASSSDKLSLAWNETLSRRYLLYILALTVTNKLPVRRHGLPE